MYVCMYQTPPPQQQQQQTRRKKNQVLNVDVCMYVWMFVWTNLYRLWLEQASTTTFVGTATYMSPERIDGKEYSYPADIWAMGLTMMAV
jgi:serine/threonine protein kinase